MLPKAIERAKDFHAFSDPIARIKREVEIILIGILRIA